MPEPFGADVRRVVDAYLCYSWDRERWPTEADLRKRTQRLSEISAELRAMVSGLNMNEHMLLCRACSDIVDVWSNPALPPDFLVQNGLDSFDNLIRALEARIDALPVRREQSTSEFDASPGTYGKPFDVFTEKLAALAERLDVPVVASKDSGSPSAFVDFAVSVLTNYRESVRRRLAEFDDTETAIAFMKSGLAEDMAREWAADERKGHEFAVRVLGNHAGSYSAAATALSSSLRRIRSARPG